MKDEIGARQRTRLPEGLMEVIAVLDGVESLEKEVLLAGEQQFRLMRDLKPANYPIMASQESAVATFGGYWRARAKFWFIASHRSRNASGIALADGWDEKFHRRALKTRDCLRDWLDSWIAVNRNTQELMKKRSDIEAVLDEYLSRQRLNVLWTTSGASIGTHPIDPSASARDEAARLFLTLIRHELCHRLGKCSRCGRIYFNRTARENKAYCSRRCGNNARNQRPSISFREKEKLSVVEAYLKSMPAKEIDWKKWVLDKRRPKELDITRHWLTRRAAEGKIKTPAKGADTK
jgi:hypothetical protein